MFIHLRTKSDYSLLESTLDISKMVDLAVQYKMPALALTDSDNLCGALEFSISAASKGVQPILGCDLSIYNDYNFQSSKILLLAYNEVGFRNIINLSSHSSIKVNKFDDLKKNSSGLIAFSGDVLSDAVESNQNITETWQTLFNIFGNNFFIEIQRYCNESRNRAEKFLLEIAYSNDIPIVATNNVLFENKKFFEAYQVAKCIAHSEYLSTKKVKETEESYFKSQMEMISIFSDLKEALHNTIKIAKKCHFMPEGREPTLPSFKAENISELEIPTSFDVDNLNDEAKILIDYSYSGLKKRFKGVMIPDEYFKRMEYELQIIINMNYSGYFLIVSDFIKWSKANNIPVGPGRGSAVGSLVSWSLYITELDPIHYGLLFERFLNPDRISMPDIDIDFCQEKRDLVIQYIHQKYKNVAHIITFGTLQPRAVLKDVGRVLQIPYSVVDNICKLIPNNPTNPIKLKEAIDLDQNLQNERDSDETITKLLSIALQLEGLYRHTSIHAAGIVISNQDLKSVVPIYYEENNDIAITQYPMKYVEKAGLIKFDFLGLKTLTIIHQTIRLINNNTLLIEDISLEDRKVFEMLSNGNSMGVFQLESHFMKETLPKLKPDNINDIIALIALNRPGPMDNIPTYIARKHGQEEISYPHELLKDVLKETFGVIIYQEQVMESARILANYSLSEADLLRRAMGKKIKQEMEMQKDAFVEGAQKNNLTIQQAQKIFEILEKFAGYGFNKSHAAAYAVISYQTAYLKANFPLEFFTAIMNLEINNTDKLALFIEDAKKNSIEIVAPSIKRPNVYFSINDGKIHYGIAAIKNVGISAAEKIASVEHYDDIWHFAKVIADSSVNKKSMESLVKSGFFDQLVKNRKQLFISIDHILKYKAHDAQRLLFDDEPEFDYVEDFDLITSIENEFEAFGFYLNHHPINIYKKLLNIMPFPRNMDMITGVISSVRVRSTPKGKFAIMELSTSEKTETIFFYDSVLIENNSKLFAEKNKVIIQFTSLNSRMVAKNIFLLEQYIKDYLSGTIIVVLNESETSLSTIVNLKNSLEVKGRLKIILRIKTYTGTCLDFVLPQKYSLILNQFLSIKEVIEICYSKDTLA